MTSVLEHEQLKLADLPFSKEKASMLEVPNDLDRWRSTLEAAAIGFRCHVTNLIQHAIDAFHPKRGECWRRKRARHADSVYSGAADLTPSNKYLLDIVAKFALFALEWLKEKRNVAFAA